MTLREELQKKFEIDCTKAPRKIWNQNNLEMIWSEEEKIYIGIDSQKREWIAALQHTTVPIFSLACTNKERKNDAEVNCGGINFVPIFAKGEITCRKCNKSFPIKLEIPKSSVAFDILEKLDR